MTPSSKNTPRTFTLLVEGDSGVSEYVVGQMTVEETPVVSPIAARVVSGEGTNLSWRRLLQALEMKQWAASHADVLKEGRVVYDA